MRTTPDEDIDARPLAPLLRLLLVVLKHNRSPDVLDLLAKHANDIRELLATEHGRRGLIFLIRYTDRVHPHVDRDTIIRHLTPLVGPGLEQTMLTFEDILRNEAVEQAMEQARREVQDEVRNETRREVLLDLLIERFGALPAAVTQLVARGSRDEVTRWSKRLLAATSLDDVFAAS